MSDTLTYILDAAMTTGWYRCEQCPTTVHVAMLSDHARLHRLWSWRIGER